MPLLPRVFYFNLGSSSLWGKEDINLENGIPFMNKTECLLYLLLLHLSVQQIKLIMSAYWLRMTNENLPIRIIEANKMHCFSTFF
jgi:hypothetical protein